MELRLYLSFKEFEKYYYNDLETWFENYSNTNEIDFLAQLAGIYKPYLYYNFSDDDLQVDASVRVKEFSFSSFGNFGISYLDKSQNENLNTHTNAVSGWKTISMMEYAQYVLDKINRYLSLNHSSRYEENLLDYLHHPEVITSAEKMGYKLDYNTHQTIIPFLKAFLPHYGQTVNIALYKEFYASVVEIANFIDRKLYSVKAFEYSIYSQLRSEAKLGLQTKHHFLTIFN
ncbi:hypothetical protein [Chryseobacterium sp.]|uniref:hypothetical protein n=1 Tax=Chryseobacterium sp. TaxID=1871047 RepID=UPI0025B9E54F|nr:hypothetical protein [Chryseobacterium sp.]